MHGNGSGALDSRVVDLLEEIVKWSRLQGIRQAREILAEVLKKDTERLAYEYSDGRGSADVGKVAGVSDFAIRSYWKRWASIGIAVPSKKFKGRYERIFSLEDLGFDVPAPRAAPIGTESAKPGVDEEVNTSGGG